MLPGRNGEPGNEEDCQHELELGPREPDRQQAGYESYELTNPERYRRQDTLLACVLLGRLWNAGLLPDPSRVEMGELAAVEPPQGCPDSRTHQVSPDTVEYRESSRPIPVAGIKHEDVQREAVAQRRSQNAQHRQPCSRRARLEGYHAPDDTSPSGGLPEHLRRSASRSRCSCGDLAMTSISLWVALSRMKSRNPLVAQPVRLLMTVDFPEFLSPITATNGFIVVPPGPPR